MKPQPGLSKQISKESLVDLPVRRLTNILLSVNPNGFLQEVGTLWVHSVPQEIVNSVSETEKKRQEAINEVIYTERDFVRDLEYLRDVSPSVPLHPVHGAFAKLSPHRHG